MRRSLVALAVVALAGLLTPTLPATAAPMSSSTCVTFFRTSNSNHEVIYANGAAFHHQACIAKYGNGGVEMFSNAPPSNGKIYFAVSERIGCTWGSGSSCTAHSGMPISTKHTGTEQLTYVADVTHLPHGSQYDLAAADDWYGFGSPLSKKANPATELMVVIRYVGNVLAQGGTHVTINHVRYILKIKGILAQFVRVRQTTSLKGFRMKPFEQYAIAHHLLSAKADLWQMSSVIECFSGCRHYQAPHYAAKV